MSNNIFTVICEDIPEDTKAEILADLPAENAKVRKIDLTPTMINEKANRFSRLRGKFGNAVKEKLIQTTPMVASWVSTDFIREVKFIDGKTMNIELNSDVMDTVNMVTMGWSRKKMRKEIRKWLEHDYKLKVLDVIYDGK